MPLGRILLTPLLRWIIPTLTALLLPTMSLMMKIKARYIAAITSGSVFIQGGVCSREYQVLGSGVFGVQELMMRRQ